MSEDYRLTRCVIQVQGAVSVDSAPQPEALADTVEKMREAKKLARIPPGAAIHRPAEKNSHDATQRGAEQMEIFSLSYRSVLFSYT